jgi:predicted Zn-dependent peptidase
VREKSVAIEVQAGTNDFRGPDWFELTCKLAGGAKVPEVEKLLDAEVARLAATAPSAAEMEKARARLAASFVLGLQSNFARAQKLAEMELYFGDANLLKTELAKYLAVTAEDVRRASAKYLTHARRSRIEVKPPSAPAAAAATTPAKVKP